MLHPGGGFALAFYFNILNRILDYTRNMSEGLDSHCPFITGGDLIGILG